MREFTLKHYVRMSEIFNRMSFYDKINIVKNNSDIITLASDGNYWGIKIKNKEIWEQFKEDYDFKIEREWNSSEIHDLISLLGMDNTDI